MPFFVKVFAVTFPDTPQREGIHVVYPLSDDECSRRNVRCKEIEKKEKVPDTMESEERNDLKQPKVCCGFHNYPLGSETRFQLGKLFPTRFQLEEMTSNNQNKKVLSKKWKS